MTVSAVQRTRLQTPDREPGPSAPTDRRTHSPAATSPRSAAVAALVAGARKAEARGPSEAEMASRLNAFMKATAGPYTVRGAEVVVTPQFRMNG